jgi:hypothetical protein
MLVRHARYVSVKLSASFPFFDVFEQAECVKQGKRAGS